LIHDFVKKPSEYDFVSEYRSFISAEFLAVFGFADVPFWTSEEKPLKSHLRVSISP
jgi:hypothetical protein